MPAYSAQAKTYRYRIYRESICPPFLARYVWHFPYALDELAMAAAAALVVGEHDFTSFAAVDPERGRKDKDQDNKNQDDAEMDASRGESEAQKSVRFEEIVRSNVRRVFSSAWRREREELIYEVRGSGFLHHMVRNLVGTFILAGKKTLQAEDDVTRILESRDRSAAGATAPANGLYLVNVEY